jgi:hypothetical protein
MDKRTIGSLTAIGGFLNEVNICEMFQNYANDANAQNWLSVMGYDHSKIQDLTAIGIPPRISKSNATKLGITNAKSLRKQLDLKKLIFKLRSKSSWMGYCMWRISP